jgi:predicted nucleic acid-binding protein
VLRVTADTNIFISRLNFAGIPRRILNLAESGAIRLAVSDLMTAYLNAPLPPDPNILSPVTIIF